MAIFREIEADGKKYILKIGEGKLKTLVSTALGRSRKVDQETILKLNTFLKTKGVTIQDIQEQLINGDKEIIDEMANYGIDFNKFIAGAQMDIDDVADLISRCYKLSTTEVEERLGAMAWDELYNAIMEEYNRIIDLYTQAAKESGLPMNNGDKVVGYSEDFQ